MVEVSIGLESLDQQGRPLKEESTFSTITTGPRNRGSSTPLLNDQSDRFEYDSKLKYKKYVLLDYWHVQFYI